MVMLARLGRLTLIAVTILAAVVACQDYRLARGPELRPPENGALRLATYNVHYIDMRAGSGRWSEDGWHARKEPLSRAFAAMAADIIAFQEMETFSGGNSDDRNLTREFLLDRHPAYRAAAVGDWREFPSTQPIFFREARFDVLDQGWFFFSETPDVIYSRTFDGSYPAFASWVLFNDKADGKKFRVVNVHTDYASSENRRRSTDLVATRLRSWVDADETVFVMGDLNARLGSELHARLEEEGLSFVPVPGATYHLNMGLNLFGAIDHIGYVGASPDRDAVVLRDKFGTVWPSDHYPVIVDFRLD